MHIVRRSQLKDRSQDQPHDIGNRMIAHGKPLLDALMGAVSRLREATVTVEQMYSG
jgi:hypothetical protein